MLNIKTSKNIRLNAQVSLKPDYLIHPTVSGNKYRKLKYNLQKAQSENYKGILTFGGAFSNHIAATASAGQALNIPTVGIIRGEELASNLNSTLQYAKSCGMHLEFVSRSDYKQKTDSAYLKTLSEKYKNFYIIPKDKRDLNYDKYFEKGRDKDKQFVEYNSSNTYQLSSSEIAKLINKFKVLNSFIE